MWYNGERKNGEGIQGFMTTSKIIRLFFSTLFIGVISSLFMRYIGGALFSFDFHEGLKYYTLFGLTVSVVSQMGFFAYLMINYFASGIRRTGFWPLIQLTVVGIVFFYFVSFRATAFGTENGYLQYVTVPLVLLIVSVLVAYFKAKATNSSALIPTIFFMFVFTTMEWIPSLQENTIGPLVLTGFTLVACNTWQIMQLHRMAKQTTKKVA